jgi:hypothetical protein
MKYKCKKVKYLRKYVELTGRSMQAITALHNKDVCGIVCGFKSHTGNGSYWNSSFTCLFQSGASGSSSANNSLNRTQVVAAAVAVVVVVVTVAVVKCS